MLFYAVLFINLAFVFYTIGVWNEKKQGTLRYWHLVVFWIGLAFDTAGTAFMSGIAGSSFRLNFHGITGLLAIVLMALHVLWASWVLFRNKESLKIKFHRFSLVVWLIWLVPFLSGAVFGMAG